MNRPRPTRWDIEQELARIWRTALDVEKLTRIDDFFALGGDSLAATKVIASIEESFNKKLPIAALIDNPTIGLLAGRIESEVDEDDDETKLLVPVRTAGARTPLFLVHGLMGHIVFAHVLGKFIGDDQPLYALRAKGFAGQSPHRSVEEMAREYLQLIREVQPRGPYAIAGYCSGSFIALEIARQLHAAGEELCATIAIDPLEPARSFTHWRLGLGPLQPGDERADAFRANLRQRLETEVYGRGVAGRRLDWAIEVATALDIAMANHTPAPFPLPLTILASDERATAIADPQKPWRRIAKTMRLNIVAKHHMELFLDRGPHVAGIIRKCLNGVDLTATQNPA